ncbi:hypothetical protein ACJX0J_006266 [Zea mays]
MYNISLYQNLATNKVTLSKHVTWSLKEKIGDRYKFSISTVLYPESGKELKAYLPVIILLKLQLNCCQIEDGQLRDISFLNITKECIRTQNLAANKYKHISARTIYVLNFQWLPKNPAIKH